MSADFKRKQAELMTATVAKNDLVICTALVQGGRAPVLVTQAMVDGMKPGSVVVDLASDGGGNCEATRPGEAYITANGVKILGYKNWPGRLSVSASNLYSKNLLTFLTTFWDKDTKTPKLPPEDVIVQGVMLTRGGAVVHANFGAAPAAPASAPAPEIPAAEAPVIETPAEPVTEPPIVASAPQPEPEGTPPPGLSDSDIAEPSEALASGEAPVAFDAPDHEAASLPADPPRPPETAEARAKRRGKARAGQKPNTPPSAGEAE
jgi:hypothetical protein